MQEGPAALALVPEGRREEIAALVAGLRDLEGVAALALGGSWARGLGRADSDVDLALYYEKGTPALVTGLRALAERVAVRPPTVTDFYAWGPWVNGGAWIDTRTGRVDVLYRSLEHVRRVLEEARSGRFETHYGQTPTHGFHSVHVSGSKADHATLSGPVLVALNFLAFCKYVDDEAGNPLDSTCK